MDISAASKLTDLMKQFPWLKDELVKVDDRFKILNNPLAKAVISNATIQTVADKAGMPVDTILAELQKILDAHKE